MRSIQFDVALMIVSLFGELAAQPGLPHQNGTLPPASSGNTSIPNGTLQPIIIPRNVDLVVTQNVPPNEGHGPLPPEEEEERQHLAEIASHPGVTIEPTRVYRLQENAPEGQSEIANAFHCEVPAGGFLLRKLPDGNYSKIIYGVLLPEEPEDDNH